MHRTALVTIVTTALTTLFLVGLAAAQTGALAGLAQPILVTVAQSIPADITVAIAQEDGEVIEATIPITLGVNVQITIDGASVVSVEPAASIENPVVAIEQQPLPSYESGDIVSQSVLSQTVDGVSVEMLSLEFISIDQYAESAPEMAEDLVRYADGPPAAAGILTVRVTNHSDTSAHVVPIQHAAIVVGGEQIDLSGFYMLINNDVDTTYFPEASKQGGVAFAVPASAWNAIVAGGTATYYIDTDDGRQYTFKIELAPTMAKK